MEAQVPEQAEIVDQIVDVIVSEGMIDRDKIKMDATIESLGLKSIDIVMILTALEEKFDVYIPMDGPFHEAKNVNDLVNAVAGYISKEKTA
ncbi:MAG TPA: acyl carrier protein [Methylovirgula sp.]|nr:acyl carrier protein [Methylovirgula sp.]